MASRRFTFPEFTDFSTAAYSLLHTWNNKFLRDSRFLMGKYLGWQ